MAQRPLRVALLWSGDREARRTATLYGNRFSGMAEALRAAGVEPQPAVYSDDMAEEVRDQLQGVDGVLVWVNPVEQGRDRSALDSLLRRVAADGVFVSAHPETVLQMGTKDVLFRTRELTWGCDTRRYSTVQELRERFPRCLDEGRPRVLKQYRGNSGNGVWKVERHPFEPGLVRVRHALRGSVVQDVSLDAFLEQCETYFSGHGRIIDQLYQERLVEGMVRCYLSLDRVVGFGRQEINALYPAPNGGPPGDAPQPGPRLYYPPATLDFQDIKYKMENEWLAALCASLSIETAALPIIWDADFLYGPKTEAGENTYVLCEINVSSVYPFPDSALEPIARATMVALSAGRR